MQNYEIEIPKLHWLIGGSKIGGTYNKYTASIGTDPNTGIFGTKIFNYQIEIVKNEDDEELICVTTFEGVKSADVIDDEDKTKKYYPLEQESLDQLNEYILGEAEACLAK